MRGAAAGAEDAIPHHPPRAKRVVQMFMAGAASHIDLFDYKPELIKRHGQPADFGEPVEAFQNGLGPWLRPVWKFTPHGQCGKWLSEVVADLGDCVDDIAFVHNLVGKSGVHSSGTLLQSTGFTTPGFPSAGAWVSYGLGSLNENLPTLRRPPRSSRLRLERPEELGFGLPLLGAPGDGDLSRDRDPDRRPDPRARPASSRRESDASALALINELNRRHAAGHEGDSRLEARIKSYELAARMQLAAPEALDLSNEPALDSQAVRPRPRQELVRAADQSARRDRRIRTQVPGGATTARAWRPLRPDLVGQRQQLPPAELGLARGPRA